MMQGLGRASLRAVRFLLVVSGFMVSSHVLADQSCRDIAVLGLGEPETIDLSSGKKVQAFYDLCYGEATTWSELDGAGPRQLHLVQRFDFYRPEPVPGDDPRSAPLVVWTHPRNQSETIVKLSGTWNNVLLPALENNFAFASVEFRHPVLSYRVDEADVPMTDIATAVQYLRFHSPLLGVRAPDVFLVSQSRGSLALLDAMLPDQAQIEITPTYKGQSSHVRAVHAYQAQTSYREVEIADTFVKPSFVQDFKREYPDLPYDPGSALAAVSADDPPIQLSYDEAVTNKSKVSKQCVILNQPPPGLPVCLPAESFDVHDGNYGVALHNAYLNMGLSSRACYALGKDNLAAGMQNYVPFFLNVIAGVPTPQPACP